MTNTANSQNNSPLNYDETQLAAIDAAKDPNNRLVCITGAPGTGKTSIIKEIVPELKKGRGVIVCAPTGRAAKRIQEATGVDAVTIHRLLEFGYPEIDEHTGKQLFTPGPKRNALNPLSYTAVLVDEYSMISSTLDSQLRAALPNGAILRAFGDVNQLQPIRGKDDDISTPPPFKQMLQVNAKTSYTLTTIHRQDEGSTIARAGFQINKGQFPSNGEGFGVCITDKPTKFVTGFVERRGEKIFDLRTQIIIPSKRGDLGTYRINQLIKSIVNPGINEASLELKREKWEEHFPVTISIGDKVICGENQYDLRDEWDRRDKESGDYLPTPPNKYIFNGETGIVTSIDEEDGSFSIDVGDRIVDVPFMYEISWKDTLARIYPQKKFHLAYAITTHKAQGTEYDEVFYLCARPHMFMHCRQNIYTAVTRARKQAWVVGDISAIKKAIAVVER